MKINYTASIPRFELLDTLVIPFFSVEDRLLAVLESYDVALTGTLRRQLEAPKQAVTLSISRGSDEILAIIVKMESSAGPAHWKKTFADWTFKHPKKDGERILLDLRAIYDPQDPEGTRLGAAAVLGIYSGFYDVGLYKSSQRKDMTPAQIYLTGEYGAIMEREGLTHRLPQIAGIQAKMMDLVNAPANRKTPAIIAKVAAEECEYAGVRCRIMQTKELENIGMRALLAVNQGSPNPPVCLVLEYTGPGDDQRKVGLVGKGVTFDTGGVSIKGSQNMHYMKSDMGGAAAVLGTLLVSARLALEIDLLGIIPLTENSVDAHSLKPGDVITSLHGSTIEVINTDAEGRLILADALTYANRHFQPDVLVDLATLTGSIVRALGSTAAGLMTQNDSLAEELVAAGQSTGERLWRMPLWKDYREMMESDVADIKNLSSKPVAGSITAAKFLEHFTDDHPAWAHVDIAGTAFGENPVSDSYSATAYGVYLMSEWLLELTKKK